jgi:pSer/pThr/pTyr-binding forkhead associated (FHA) protein
VLLDHLVSRNHARINYTNRRFYITDLASSNGTKVNGLLIKRPDYPLTVDKDIITIGSYTIQLKRTYRHE